MKYLLTIFYFALILSSPARCQEKQSPASVFDDLLIVRADADILPDFLNGYHGWVNFLRENLNANIGVANNAPAGVYTILLKFVADEKGRVRNVTPLSNYGYGMEQEAIRVLKQSLWRPASINGKAVTAYRTIAITFSVPSTPKSI